MSKNKFRFFNVNYWLRKLSFSFFFQKLFFFFPETVKRKFVFLTIYKSYHWRSYNKPTEEQSISGLGSDMGSNSPLIISLKKFIETHKIKNILDLGCGDFNWMRHVVVNNKNIKKYLGYDIVKDIVIKNNNKFSNKIISFKNKDILEIETINKYDLVIVRDLFIHIKNHEILKILNNIKMSKSKYAMFGNYQTVEFNNDLTNYGHHREVNLERDPFHLRKPIIFFDDNEKQRSIRKLNIYRLNDQS